MKIRPFFRNQDYALFVIILTSTIFFVGCSNEPASGPVVAKSPGKTTTSTSKEVHPTAIELSIEFSKIAKQLKESDNAYFGRKSLEILERIVPSKLSIREQAAHHATKSWQYLRVGDLDNAVKEADQAYALKGDNITGFPIRPVLMCRALAYMRLAETENCVKRHNCDCCIFPLTAGGIHVDKKPAETAKQNLLEVLEYEPDNFHVIWLLNVLAMALDEYPDGIPELFRIPTASFESDYDIKRFRDVADKLGVNTFNLCGGVIVDDMDGDRRLDIVTSTYDPDGQLTYYRNNGDGTFSDRSLESNLNQQYGGLNCIGADYDGDGDTDILILRGAWLKEQGEIRNSLLRNDGAGVFTDVTKHVGLALPAYPTQAAVWGDFNGDGHLDLYVCNESRSTTLGTKDYFPSQLFINRGDNTFEDRARAAGVTNDYYAKGVAAGDFDNDGDLDIYVSNLGPNRLYENLGDGAFEDVAVDLDVVQPISRSFATWFFDYDNDGWLDLFVTAYDATVDHYARYLFGVKQDSNRARLYRNLGNGTFREVGDRLGLDFPCLPMGANFGDLDNDGYLDIYLTTGDPQYQTLMPNVMLKNDAGKSFLDVTTTGGFGHLQKGHGVAFADIDEDGDQDIYHQLGGFFPGDKFANVLFENPGHGNHFLILKLVGIESNRSAIGARIEVVVESDDGIRSIHRAVGSVSSFGGSPSRQEIGLGKAIKILRVEIKWPSGKVQELDTPIALDAMLEITENGEQRSIEMQKSNW